MAKVKIKAVQPNTCPFCKSENVEYVDACTNGRGGVFYQAVCSDCGRKYAEWAHTVFDCIAVYHGGLGMFVYPNDVGIEVEVDD